MNNEIKKALEEINILGNTILNDTTYKPTINRREALYNYITNLQQENKILKYKKLEKQFPDLNAVTVEIDTYKSRIDKAIEYIDNIYSSLENVDRPIKMYDDLLSILQGEDNE